MFFVRGETKLLRRHGGEAYQSSIKFLQSLGVVPHTKDPDVIHYDSMLVLVYVKDPIHHGNSKHVRKDRLKTYFYESYGD